MNVRFARFASLMVIGLAALAPGGPQAQAAEQIFMRIPAIEGESTVAGREGWMDVLSVGYGARNTGTTHLGGGGGEGQSEFEDIKIVRRVDGSSPALFLRVANGQHLDTVTIEFTKSTAHGPQVYLMLELTDVIISSLRHSFQPTADGLLPTEVLAVNYRQITIEFTRDDGSSTSTQWDVAAGTGS